jgi:hypothetical protein
MPAMAPLAIASIVASGASAVGTLAASRKSQPNIPPPPQPEKAPQYDVFKRRNTQGPGAYGIAAPGALADASTASTKLGQ